MVKFVKGNCLPAAWELAMSKLSDKKNKYVIVHAMREIADGSEFWGGHAFVLNKTTNRVLSEANNDMQQNGGIPLDVSFEVAKEMWNLQPQDETMYVEYTIQEYNMMLFENEYYDEQTCENMVEHRFYGLKYENWKDKGWQDYMNKYFLPTYCPHTHAKRLEKAGA